MSRRDIPPEPSTTLYAILGMIAIRPMTAYELTKRFDRSLGRFWPRARSKLMEGPKRLVALGWARATHGKTGRRPKTVYSITPAGRRALRAWLARPGTGPSLEFEQLMKVFFAEHGSRDALTANLEAALSWAHEEIEEHAAVAREYLQQQGPFPERAAQLIVTGRFLAELTLAVERWATWALRVTQAWPDEPRNAVPDLEQLAESLRMLEAGARDPRG